MPRIVFPQQVLLSSWRIFVGQKGTLPVTVLITSTVTRERADGHPSESPVQGLEGSFLMLIRHGISQEVVLRLSKTNEGEDHGRSFLGARSLCAFSFLEFPWDGRFSNRGR